MRAGGALAVMRLNSREIGAEHFCVITIALRRMLHRTEVWDLASGFEAAAGEGC